jgi:hypothetical protein
MILAFGASSGASAQNQVVSWSEVGSEAASDVGVGADGTLWAIDTLPARVAADGKRVLRMGGGRFGAVDRAGVRIAVDTSGSPWVVDAWGKLFTWSEPPRPNSPRPRARAPELRSEQWVQRPLPISVLDVAVGANGAVWLVARDFRLYHLVGDRLVPIAASAIRVAVDPQGAPWIIDRGGKLLRRQGGTFDPVPGVGSAIDVSIAPNGTVFFLGNSAAPGLGGNGGGEQLYSIRGGTIRAEGIGGVAVSAGPRSVYVALAQKAGSHIYSRPYGIGDSAMASPLILGTLVTVATVTPMDTTAKAVMTADAQGNIVGDTLSMGSSLSTGGQLAVSNGSDPGLPGSVEIFGLTQETPPDSGSLICPIIGKYNKLEMGCQLMRSAALSIRGFAGASASATDCTNSGSFFDLRNGGECWACPASYIRNVSAVTAKDACWKRASERLAPAHRVGRANGMQCEGRAFFDPIDGGTCWTCPAEYRRTLESVKRSGACAITVPIRYSVATQTRGCSLVPTPVGYGTAFQSIVGSGECWACPIPLLDNWSESRKDAAAACTAGGNTDRIVWKMPQYPEPGLYGFVPGLVEIAFADPKRVDEFLGQLAGGDDWTKRQLWDSMGKDPGASPAFQALLFAALVTAAHDSGANAAADASVARFGEYVRARRTFIAREATRMWDAWQIVDNYNKWQATRMSNGMNLSPAVLGSAGLDFDAYAWAGAKPDTIGRGFLAAAMTLGALPGAAGDVSNYSVERGFDTILLQPIFEGLDKAFEMLQEMGQKAAVSTTKQLATTGRDVAMLGKGGAVALVLVSQGIDLWQAIQAVVETKEAQSKYAKLVSEADRPAQVGKVLTTGSIEAKQQLVLFWALASSPHSSSIALGTGSRTTAQLCAEQGSKADCAEAKSVVANAMQKLGY